MLSTRRPSARTLFMVDWHALSLLLHLLALALWLGGMAFFLAAFGPALKDLPASAAMRSLNHGRMAFESVAWIGITLLMITGGVNLVLRSQLTGAHLGRTYMIIVAIKLFLFVAMLVHHTLQVFKYGSKIAALTNETPADSTAWPEPLRALWKRWFMLLKLNAGLGLVAMLLGVLLMES